MKPNKKYTAYFNYIDGITLKGEVIDRCFHSGDCEDDVRECLLREDVKKELARIDPGQLKKELSAYGAWDDEQLEDHEYNLVRILWIAAGDIQDNK
jgi:hypothetical protein